VEETGTYKTSVNVYRKTLRHIPDNRLADFICHGISPGLSETKIAHISHKTPFFDSKIEQVVTSLYLYTFIFTFTF
jgi:hypothetical protein